MVQKKRPFLKDLIPCLHFSFFFKNLQNVGGVKLKHLLEIQNTPHRMCPSLNFARCDLETDE
jgi:hypothetical protein